MTLRIASDRVVHVWHGDAFGALHLGPSIDGIVSCAAFGSATDSFWVGLADGRIACTSLARCADGGVVDIANDFLNEEQTVDAAVGVLCGLVVPDQGPTVLEAFGRAGWATFNAKQQILQSDAWTNPTDAVTHAALLRQGRLRRAVAPDGALLTVDASGRIRVVRARSLADALTGGQRPAASVDMAQPPALVALSPKGDCAVVIGELRAVVVFFVSGGEEGVLSVARAFIPGESAAIDGCEARVVFLDDGRVRIYAGLGGHRLGVSMRGDEPPKFLSESDELIGVADADGGANRSTRVGDSLAPLLRGIEQAATLQKTAEEKGRQAERRIASYNAALLFALQSNAKAPRIGIECAFSGSLAPPANSPSFFVSPTWEGVNAFVNVELKSTCDIAVGTGWNVRLTMESVLGGLMNASEGRAHGTARPNGGRAALSRGEPDEESGLPDAQQQTEDRRQPIRAAQLTAPLPGLPARGTCTVAFPVALVSHAPLCVSVELHYTLGCDSSAGTTMFASSPARSRGLVVSLAKDVVLDAISFIHLGPPIRANSNHLRLRSARLARALGGEIGKASLPLSSRIAIPTGSTSVKTAIAPLQLPTEFTTFLGAECALEPGGQASEGMAYITLRAPPDALPFLRAAILRRMKRSSLGSVHASSAREGILWANALRKSAGEALPMLDSSEGAVRDLASLSDAVSADRLELCAKGEDVRALRRATAAVEAATRRWRERARLVWDPAASVGPT